MSLVVKDGLVVTQNPGREILRGDVLIEDGRIAALGAGLGGDEILDANGCAVIPGLINTHGHVSMTLMRGAADDLQLEQFLERMFALDARRTREDVRAGAILGCVEMILFGTTSFLDLYYHEDAVAEAVQAVGLRGYLGWVVLDDDLTTQKGSPIKNCEAFAKAHTSLERIAPIVAPQGVYVCSEETLAKSRELAEHLDLGMHMHLSETRQEVHEHERKTGLRPVPWLERIGFLSPRLSAAHCVWMTISEIRTLRKHGVGVAHCPVSNAKLASGGVAPVPEMHAEGLAVGLGTDSAVSNNCLDLFQEMKCCALTHKSHRWDATVLPAQRILDMATIEGARVLRAEKRIGSIEVGKSADIAVIDLSAPSLVPSRPENLVSNLVYACTGAHVRDVLVGGEVVVRDRNPTRCSYSAVRREAEERARTLLEM
ncbi:MAG: amidohydrolase family protein [Candidatus Thermoplasmatota archaeon]